MIPFRQSRYWEGCPRSTLFILHGELEVRPEEVIAALSKYLLLEICDEGTIDQPLLLERRYSLKKKKKFHT